MCNCVIYTLNKSDNPLVLRISNLSINIHEDEDIVINNTRIIRITVEFILLYYTILKKKSSNIFISLK